MSSSPTQELLDRIDRLHLMLVSELPILSATIPPRITIDPVTSLSINNITTTAFHSTVKSELVIIDELQQYINKMEYERQILLRSYSIILQLLKYNDIDAKTNLIDHDYLGLVYNVHLCSF
jgi:hypothetical protein